MMAQMAQLMHRTVTIWGSRKRYHCAAGLQLYKFWIQLLQYIQIVHTNILFFGQIQSFLNGDQPYSDTPPPNGECSLVNV